MLVTLERKGGKVRCALGGTRCCNHKGFEFICGKAQWAKDRPCWLGSSELQPLHHPERDIFEALAKSGWQSLNLHKRVTQRTTSFSWISACINPSYSMRTETNQSFVYINFKHTERTSNTVTVPSLQLQQRPASSKVPSYLCLERGVRVD